MSGLETERIQERVRGMTAEQQRAVAEALPDELLWEAVYGRFIYLQGRNMATDQMQNCQY